MKFFVYARRAVKNFKYLNSDEKALLFFCGAIISLVFVTIVSSLF